MRSPSPLGRVAPNRLSLTDFRNYRLLRLDVGPEPVVIVGANGTGKTSVLEALSLLGPGRGLRRARLAEMLRTGGASRLPLVGQARLLAGSGPTDIVTAFAAGRQRAIGAKSGSTGRRRAARPRWAQTLGLIWLTPEMDRLFTEGPSARRRFLDRLVWGWIRRTRRGSPPTSGRCSERSALLRQERDRTLWLGALEEAMTTHGIAVAAARRQSMVQLSETGADSSDDFPRAQIEARGVVEDWLDEGPALVAEERLPIGTGAVARLDAEKRRGAFGPHRSDLVVRHGGSGRSAQECSTGEQKMLLIAARAGGRAAAEARARKGAADAARRGDGASRCASSLGGVRRRRRSRRAGMATAPRRPLPDRASIAGLSPGDTGQHSWPASLNGAETVDR